MWVRVVDEPVDHQQPVTHEEPEGGGGASWRVRPRRPTLTAPVSRGDEETTKW